MIVRCGRCRGTGLFHRNPECPAAHRTNRSRVYTVPVGKPEDCICAATYCEACGGLGCLPRRERFTPDEAHGP